MAACGKILKFMVNTRSDEAVVLTELGQTGPFNECQPARICSCPLLFPDMIIKRIAV